jgi:dihydropyrimidinase
MLSEGVNKRRITLEKLVEVCSSNAARYFGVYPKKGVLRVGSDADVVIVDLKKHLKLTIDQLHSAADYQPYEGWSFVGWPTMTIRWGEIVMEDGQVVGKPGTGEYVSRTVTAS